MLAGFFLVAGVCFGPLCADSVIEPSQDYVMLLNTCSNAHSMTTGEMHFSHQDLTQPKPVRNVRCHRIQVWRSLPLSSQNDGLMGHNQYQDDNGVSEAFLSPDVDQTITILDPSAYLGSEPGQGEETGLTPAGAECLDVTHKTQAVVWDAVRDPHAKRSILPTG